MSARPSDQRIGNDASGLSLPKLPDAELPVLYQSADAASLLGQRSFLRITILQMGFLISAAAAGALATSPAGASISGAAFVMTAMLRLHLVTSKPDRKWYDGRALAESIKTLAWRYSVGGAPFPIDLAPQEADRLFVERSADVLSDFSDILLVAEDGTGDQITDRMRTLRTQTLQDRKTIYEHDRIENQRQWYASKAGWNSRRANHWNAAMLVLELTGACVAFLVATNPAIGKIGLLGLVSTAIAASSAWMQTKQHLSLARAYAVASHELAAIKQLVRWHETDEEWAHFVSQSEEAISREHTVWRASRV